jgi:hypothetical protein
VKATLEARSSLGAASPGSNPFLKSFEELDMKEEIKDVEETQLVGPDEGSSNLAAFEVGLGPLSPTKLAEFFAEIDRHYASDKVADVKNFQKLILPLVNGHKPTAIEEARIRQAAVKAKVSLDLVDTFVGYVKFEHPEIIAAASSKEEPPLIFKNWDEVEDVNEDEAIAGFLMRFQSQKNAADKKTSAVEKSSGDENNLATNVFEEDAVIPTDTLDVDVNEKLIVNISFAPTGDSLHRRSNDFITNMVRSSEEEDEAWWRHAGSPKTSNGASFASPSEDHQYSDLDEVISESEPRQTQTFRRQRELSIDTDLLSQKSKHIQKFDEDIWRRRTAMATYGWGWEEATWLSPRGGGSRRPAGLDGITAVEGLTNFMFNKNSFVFARRNWKLSYKQRTKGHSGYFDVDLNSLLESATFGKGHWPSDDTPWEVRYVRQRFLHERSLSFSRNWFGTLEKVNGNDKIKAPVCKPKSMEMPMENIPDDGQWDVEWYTTWSARKNMPKPPPGCATFGTDGEETAYESEYGSEEEGSEGTGSYTGSSTYIGDDDEEWEDAPECGTLVNVKQKIGERVSRVHPDYTSFLRRSRWRKKYFPKGAFPY